MNPETINAVRTLGLSTVLSIGVFYLCVWITKYVITNLVKQLDRHAILMEKQTDAIQKLTAKLQADIDVRDRNARYVRDEHKKIADTLERLVDRVDQLVGQFR